jgi:Mlc titration factor MtfA (ptsG expression regulator)/transglutaminase-like putative cysteine protease
MKARPSLVATPATPTQLRLAALAFAAAWLPHADRVPLWCSAVAALVLVWRMAPRRGVIHLPPAPLRIALALLLAAAVLLAMRSLASLTAGTTLLLAMGSAKLLETRSRRDLWAVAVTALFLTLAALLDRQALLRVPLYALAAWLACALLAALGGRAESSSVRAALRESGGALLWALPFAVLVFVLFPRVPGGLWGLPGGDRGSSGLGEEMSPGSISELSLSDAIAFRVRFEGQAPPPAERYWRGPVLHDFDGYTWRRGGIAPAPVLEGLGEPLRYRVTLEPHGHAWWYSLDTIDASPSPRVTMTFDHQLYTFQPVTQVVSYDAVSHLRTRSDGPLSRTEQRMDLRLDPARNRRTQALAREWAARLASPRDIVATALALYRDQGFRYTLTPPLLDFDSVDDFLFNTRLGFCGHFASSFVTLMRAAGIPARVVTGYQGGEWNPMGGYLVVRQSDAHAWAEVWLEGEGWQRVDPTAMAAPERLTRGLRELMPDVGDAAARFVRRNPWIANLLRGWDAANTWWQSRVIEYDGTAQLRLLSRLGLPDADYRLMALLLLGGASAWAGLYAWQLRRARGARPDETARQWLRLRALLESAGVPAPLHAPPGTLLAHAAALLPELAQPLRQAGATYLAQRYGPPRKELSARKADPKAGRRALSQAVDRVAWRLRARRREAAWPPLPDAERAALDELPWYGAMPAPLRDRTSRLAARLLTRVPFVGRGGLVVDARVRALIAFQASLLVVTRDLSLYASLRSVLVYPDEFVVQERDEDEAGVVTEGSRSLAGQTIDDTRIVISWADVLDGLAHADGYNVVLHEFAHFLDHVAAGQLSAGEGHAWHETLDAEYRELCAAVDAGQETLIDPYGAEDPAEFFAVCTEVFFELPAELRALHPGLYAALSDFYALDPVSWVEDPAPATAARHPG